MCDCSVVGFPLSLNKGKKNRVITILAESVLLSNNNEGILLKLLNCPRSLSHQNIVLQTKLQQNTPKCRLPVCVN